MRPLFATLPLQLLFWSILAVLVGWWLVMLLRRKAGVWRLRYYAFPRPWLKFLHEHVPLYERLPWELRAPYQDKVLHFVDSKNFRACGAMEEVTEDMRVTIAGNACLLLLNEISDSNFPEVLTVQVYPQSEEEPLARSSCVAMLWDAEKMRATGPRDRDTESLAAIAAQLGWKALPEPLLLAAWARVRSAAFIVANPGILGKAAAGNPSEVFAIATEMFLAAPAVLQQHRPELYAAMRQFYHVDPARWTLKQ